MFQADLAYRQALVRLKSLMGGTVEMIAVKAIAGGYDCANKFGRYCPEKF